MPTETDVRTASQKKNVTPPDGTTSPFARAVLDTLTITRRDLQHWRRLVGLKVFGWLWPVLIMLMFLGLMGGALEEALGGSYLDFMMPGVLAMTMFFGLESTMLAVCQDASRGVTDRFRSLPMNGIAVVGGRCLADLLDSAISLVVVSLAGVALGWRPEVSIGEAMMALGLLLLLRVAVLWVGIYIGLKAPAPEALTPVSIAVWPVLFLSSVFMSTATMPTWLGAIADANPISGTATTLRELLGSPVSDHRGTWFAEHAELLAIAWPVVLIVVFLPMAISAYRGLNR